MQAAQVKAYEVGTVLYMAMELSNSKWKLGFGNGAKLRRKSIEARDCKCLLDEVALAKAKLKLPEEARVVCCFEAGRDGHWIYRWLESAGFEVLEVDSSSIETARGRKHVKTDRVDVEKLLDLLIRHYCLGLRQAFSVVRVPSVAAEAGQRLHREDEHLLTQRTRISNRIKALLGTQGVTELRLGKGFMARLERLKSVGPKSSRLLAAEVFAWRRFDNTKQVGAMAGLTPTPSQSGDTETEQGISKAGNRRVRRTMIELTWLWLRWQPDALSQWFNRRWAHGDKRQRRVGIVAMARKLLIALWRYVEHGVIPEGAVLKA